MSDATSRARSFRRVEVIDSHTEGEPTRVVVAGGPDLGGGPLPARRARFEAEHDDFRRAVVGEPRGSESIVGALVVPPEDRESAAGVIFFNNVGFLGMCGHGTIGLVTTLAHLGRLGPGSHTIETPAGPVEAHLDATGRVSVRNVPSYRYRSAISLDVPGHGVVVGDIAYGGNWFFLTERTPTELSLAHAPELTAFTIAVRDALERGGVTGREGARIDHVEISGPPRDARNHARNFVLCPGGMYDRSPCGTGTSAKMACLAAEGRLRSGELWRQEGILGTVFEGSVSIDGDSVRPTIAGRAFVTAESELLFDPDDPFPAGISR